MKGGGLGVPDGRCYSALGPCLLFAAWPCSTPKSVQHFLLNELSARRLLPLPAAKANSRPSLPHLKWRYQLSLPAAAEISKVCRPKQRCNVTEIFKRALVLQVSNGNMLNIYRLYFFCLNSYFRENSAQESAAVIRLGSVHYSLIFISALFFLS